MLRKSRRAMTGGSSAVMVLDSTGCSIRSSSSSLLIVRFEFDRYREVAKLSVRVRVGA